MWPHMWKSNLKAGPSWVGDIARRGTVHSCGDACAPGNARVTLELARRQQLTRWGPTRAPILQVTRHSRTTKSLRIINHLVHNAVFEVGCAGIVRCRGQKYVRYHLSTTILFKHSHSLDHNVAFSASDKLLLRHSCQSIVFLT